MNWLSTGTVFVSRIEYPDMRTEIPTILAGTVLSASLGWAFWWTIRRWGRTVDGAIWCYTAASILFGVGLGSSLFIGYAPWFVSGLCIGLAVFVSQLIHAISVKHVLQSEVADTQLLRLFLGLPAAETDDKHVGSTPRSVPGSQQSRYERSPPTMNR